MASEFVAGAASIASPFAVPTHQVGDIIFCLLANNSTTVTPATPAGFTLLLSGTGHNLSYRIATGTSSTTDPIVFTTTPAAAALYAQVFIYREFFPPNATFIKYQHENTSSCVYPALTGLPANSWVLSVEVILGSGTADVGIPTGQKNRYFANGALTLSGQGIYSSGVNDTNGVVASYATNTVVCSPATQTHTFSIGLVSGIQMTVPTGTFALTGHAAAVAPGALPLPVSPGAFALTGGTATLQPSSIGVEATPGAFALTGGTATFTDFTPAVLAAATGHFALASPGGDFSGQSALVGVAGSFALTGHTATLLKEVSLSPGRFALAGEATLKGDFRILATMNRFVLTGHAAVVAPNRKFLISPGTFEVTPGTALFSSGSSVSGTGAFHLNGGTANYLVHRRMLETVGRYGLAGSTAKLAHDLQLTTPAGNFALAGSAADMLIGFAIAGTGTVVIDSAGVTLAVARKIVLNTDTAFFQIVAADGSVKQYPVLTGQGSYRADGSTGQLTQHRAMFGTGVYVLTGSSLETPTAHELPAVTGHFVVTSHAVAALVTRRLVATPGAFAVAGAGSLAQGLTLLAAPGQFEIIFESIATLANRQLLQTRGVFELFGEPATLMSSSSQLLKPGLRWHEQEELDMVWRADMEN